MDFGRTRKGSEEPAPHVIIAGAAQQHDIRPCSRLPAVHPGDVGDLTLNQTDREVLAGSS